VERVNETFKKGKLQARPMQDAPLLAGLHFKFTVPPRLDPLAIYVIRAPQSIIVVLVVVSKVLGNFGLIHRLNRVHPSL
jgi:hypothetical protein